MGARVTRVPPRWKMASVTWIGVCLTVYAVNALLSQFAPQCSWWVRFFLSNTLVVAGLTWAVMPLLNRMMRQWLLPARQIQSE